MPWYFAYGSNMQSATLRGRRGVTWTRALAVRVAGWRVVFDKPPLLPSPHSFANLVPDRAAEAFGVAFEVSDDDLAHIELTEGVMLDNYRRVMVPVEPLAAMPDPPRQACSLASDRRDGSLVPSTRYMGFVIEGALEHGLPDAWIAALRGVPCIEETAETLAMRAVLDEALRQRMRERR